MKTISLQQINNFQSFIRSRRENNRRDFPRRQTTDPYEIRISETMLAQTQASRVVNYYRDRLRKFPTVQDLSEASLQDVLHARSGLGYNSRAQRILQAAKLIVNNDGGVISDEEGNSPFTIHNSPFTIHNSPFPTTYSDLISLPGVGDYTTNAILAFAYNQNVAVIDTNIRRILIHHFTIPETTPHAELKDYALQILPKGYARPRYNALMDYGALELTARKTGIKALTQQSKFEGSQRQVRARVLKTILHSKGKTTDRQTIQTRFSDRNDLQDIIDGLVREGLIRQDGNLFIITQ